jgi:hypothetical protein
MTAQEELDAVAAANSWQVTSGLDQSVYVRGDKTVSVVFSYDRTRVTDVVVQERPFDATVKDWKGKIGNILRARWRTYETGEE